MQRNEWRTMDSKETWDWEAMADVFSYMAQRRSQIHQQQATWQETTEDGKEDEYCCSCCLDCFRALCFALRDCCDHRFCFQLLTFLRNFRYLTYVAFLINPLVSVVFGYHPETSVYSLFNLIFNSSGHYIPQITMQWFFMPRGTLDKPDSC